MTIRKRSALFAVLCLLFCGVLQLSGITSTASADTLGYPDVNATDCSAQYGEYSWCEDGSDVSSRGYGYRNCTDYVAWKLQTLGVPDSKTRGLHNGGQWADNAYKNGLSWSTTPKEGDAAVQQSTSPNDFGHVAYVESVNGNGTITVSEYNYHENGTGDYRTGTPASLNLTKFVDFGVSSSSPAPISRASADFNGDFKSDIGWYQGSTLDDLQSGGDGTYGVASSLSLGTPTWAASGDINGDGFADVLWYQGDTLYTIQSNGSGGFGIVGSTSLGTPTWAGVGDYTGDGDADLAWYQGGTLYTIQSNGNGSFGIIGSTSLGAPTWALNGSFDGSNGL